ncbi:hypothetical protein D3C73_1277010 [compost metagenome]
MLSGNLTLTLRNQCGGVTQGLPAQRQFQPRLRGLLLQTGTDGSAAGIRLAGFGTQGIRLALAFGAADVILHDADPPHRHAFAGESPGVAPLHRHVFNPELQLGIGQLHRRIRHVLQGIHLMPIGRKFRRIAFRRRQRLLQRQFRCQAGRCPTGKQQPAHP